MKIFAIVVITSVASLTLATGATLAASGGTSRPFQSSGSGTEMSLSATGCQFTAVGCTVQSDGTAVSSHLGTGPYTSTLTVDWAQAYSNGDGGYCAPASGSATLTAADGATVTLTESGTVCEVGASALNAPHNFTGTYTVTGGTGNLMGASGSGSISGSDDGAGNSSYSMSGTISY